MNELYKYCPIHDPTNFKDEYSIINLLNNQITFSTRNNFNDLFDSKIDFIKPSKSDLKKTYSLLKGKKKHEFKGLFFGLNGKRKFDFFYEIINKRFDEYLILCLTDRADNNLMWSHYSSSHKGFCLEFDATKIKAEKVIYKKNIASFHILDAIKMDFGLLNKHDVGEDIWDALKVKLKEWEYEGEHRVHLSDRSLHLINKKYDDFSLVSYESSIIKSIIFGCKMSDQAIRYLKERLPKHVQLKYAVEGRDKIIIRDDLNIKR